MSLVTKIFIVLTAIAGVIFLLMAGSLIAKQEQFKVRLAAERINRVHEELIQDRFQNRFAALLERKRRSIFKSREYILIQNAVNTNVKAKAENAQEGADRVKREVVRFDSIRNNFETVIKEYTTMLTNIMDQVEELAKRRNEVINRRNSLWTNLASIEAKVGHKRETINLLDYNLYRISHNNREKRQLIEIYREIDPSIYIPGMEGTLLPTGGEIISYDEEHLIVVINHGYNSNVEKHQIFTVTRSDKYIAQIEIFNVSPNRAAGRVLPRTMKEPIRVGDSVRPRAVFAGGH